jgi:hypothetical protein
VFPHRSIDVTNKADEVGVGLNMTAAEYACGFDRSRPLPNNDNDVFELRRRRESTS